MVQTVAGLSDVEWGKNDSPEGKNQGYSHCIMMTFCDDAARVAYLTHPEHLKAKEVFRPTLEDIIVFDYSL